jgi:hypothetical protein
LKEKQPGSFNSLEKSSKIYCMQQNKRIHYATLAVMVLSVVLSFIHFLCNRSLWLDEAMVSLNIINRSYTGLLNPLDYMQVAPIGFLEMEKMFSVLIPNSEYGLRIFPLLCFWASVYLFYKVTLILSKDAKIVLLSVSVFCLNTSLLYYSSEVKQYMTDVFVCLLMYYLLLKEYKNNTNRTMLLTLFGIVSICLSNISPIILCTIGLFLLISQVKNKQTNYLYLLMLFFIWTLGFGLYYYRFIYQHPNRAGMLAYWGNSFMPINIFKIDFWDFCFYKTKMLFGSLLSFGVTGLIPFVFFLIGLYKLHKDKCNKILFLLLLPSLLQLVLSGFKLYPFDLRLVLYQAGFFILILSVGVMHVTDLGIQKTKKQLIAWVPVIFPVILCIGLLKNYPFKVEEIKRSLGFIENNIQPNETIYVYYGSIPAFKYYIQTGKIDVKNQVIYGNGYRGNERKYIDEIKSNKLPYWILFSHIHDKENSSIIQSLDSVYEKKQAYKTIDSEVYLYDLKKN